MFEDLVVVDFTNNIAGPFCTQIFSYYGAEVIKIEKVGTGDDTRAFAPMIDGEGIGFRVHNRGKKSLEIDLKEEANIEIIKEIIRQADVVVESFRPGVMGRLGLDFTNLKKINETLIMCSISAYGNTGPYREYPGYDVIAQAMSGIMSLTGYADGEPMKIGPSIADYFGGINAFGAICAALYKREKKSEGDYIDIALVDCLVAANDYYESAYIDGYTAFRSGNQHALITPYGIFTGLYGSVVIGALNDRLWNRLANLIDDEVLRDEEKFGDCPARVKNVDIIVDRIVKWLNTFTDIDEPLERLKEAGVPAAPVLNTWELRDDPQLQVRGVASTLKTPDLSVKEIPARGMHLHFLNAKGEMGPPPQLGEHNEEILKKYRIKESDEESA